MKDLALRYAIALIFYFVGERIIILTYQRGENSGLGFWGALRATFDYQNYSFPYITMIAVVGMFVLISDWITPGRATLIALSLFSAACGAYFYIMFYGYDQFAPVDKAIYTLVSGILPQSIAQVVGPVVYLVSALVPPLLLLVILKFVGRRLFQ